MGEAEGWGTSVDGKVEAWGGREMEKSGWGGRGVGVKR